MKRNCSFLIVAMFFMVVVFHFSCKKTSLVTKHTTATELQKSNFDHHLIPSFSPLKSDGAPTTVWKLNPGFITNRGQLNENVKFFAKTFRGNILISNNGLIEYRSFEQDSIKESFVGGRLHEIKGEEESATRVSYFKGNNSSKWRSNIPTYESISFGEVYDGIEVKIREHGNNIEKLFYIAPKALPEDIRMKVEGDAKLKVNGKGELEITNKTGTIGFTRPVAYQEKYDANGNIQKEYVDIAYSVHQDEYGFHLGSYDKTRKLIIDPLLSSTFLGGYGDDIIYAMKMDKNGNIYVCGTTSSPDLPANTGNNKIPLYGDVEGFVAKFSGDLKTLMALTYLGGSSNDGFYDMDMDSSGNLFVIGSSSSKDFPITSNAYSETFGGGETDGIVAKLDANLSLLSATYAGGSGDDVFSSLVIDQYGNVFVGGRTFSPNVSMPASAYSKSLATTYNASCGNNCLYDALLIKFDNNLNGNLAATYLGGTGEDAINSMVIDSNGHLYVAGVTGSKDFPITTGAFDTIFNSHEVKGFISKFDTDLTSLIASTFIGGSFIDAVMSTTLDETGNVVIAGYTFSTSNDFPTTPGAYSTTRTRATDIFISKLSSDLSTLVASTYFGGNENIETGEKVYPTLKVDTGGNIYIAGYTSAKDFPVTSNAFDTTCGKDGLCNKDKKDVSLASPSDAFISVFSGDLKTLKASTYLGGKGSTIAYALTLAPNGNIFVAGSTSSSDFPTTSEAYARNFKGKYDAFISKFDSDLSSNNTAYELKVDMSEKNVGTVKSVPSGILCGNNCSHSFVFGKKVNLIAKAFKGYYFQEWDGACSGNGKCIVEMDADKSATAIFAKYPPEISIQNQSINFGEVKVGGTSKKSLSIANKGKGTLTISNISFDSGEFTSSNQKTIKPKSKGFLSVSFSPTSTGSKTATMTIFSDDPIHPTSIVTLNGIGK